MSGQTTQTVHTPGPWSTGTDPNPADQVFGPDGLILADCKWAAQVTEQRHANARLIAAAPALLAALQTIHAGNTLSGEFTHADVIQEHYRIARAAIAQATTGTQEPARPTAVSETWPRILEALRAANVPDLVDHGHNAVILQGSDLRALIRLVETQVTTR